MRWRYVVAMLAVGSCSRAPGVPQPTRPEWRGAAIDGIAPLMTSREIAAALAQRGYRQVPCAIAGKLLVDPLERGDGKPCYRSPSRTMQISLYFLELDEGRRLAVADFSEPFATSVTDAARNAASRAFEQRLNRRFGPPSHVTRDPSFRIVYWYRPGGQPLLPDSIRTTIDPYSGANVSLTSMWAYAQARAQR